MNQMELLSQCVSRPASAPAQTGGTAPRPGRAENTFQQLLEQQNPAPGAQTAARPEEPVPSADISLLPDELMELISRQELAAALAAGVLAAPDQTPDQQNSAPELSAPPGVPVLSQYSAAAPETDGVQQPVLTQQPVSQQPLQPAAEESRQPPVSDARQSAGADMDGPAQQETAFTALSQPQRLFPDGSEVPLKVGDAPPLEAGAPDFENQLAAKIGQTFTDGKTHLELRLSPEALGTVVVDVARDETGVLHVALTAANERAQSILDRHASGLQALLADTAPAAVEVHVQRQEESGQPQQYPENSGEQRQDPQRHSQKQQQNDDFLQQMRLGLTAVYSEAS